MRFFHTPLLFRYLYNPRAVWQMKDVDKTIYLTFDDGPTLEITQWILNILAEYQAKATFFCVGDNVVKYPDIFRLINEQGHATGNHTYNHLNGWKTDTAAYCRNIMEADDVIGQNLFRPPYGKMKRSQIKLVNDLGYKTILWSVLTYDFDQALDQHMAWNKIVKYTKSGSILVFHDHEKAFANLQVLLPRVLQHFSSLGYVFEKIEKGSRFNHAGF